MYVGLSLEITEDHIWLESCVNKGSVDMNTKKLPGQKNFV